MTDQIVLTDDEAKALGEIMAMLTVIEKRVNARGVLEAENA